MDMKENDSKRHSVANAVLNVSHKKHSQLSISSVGSNGSTADQMSLRRPFGVAAIDLTPIIRKPEDFKNNLDLPFILCEKENLDNTLKKLLTNKDVGKIDSKLAVSVELLHGDIKQVNSKASQPMTSGLNCSVVSVYVIDTISSVACIHWYQPDEIPAKVPSR